MNIKENTTHQQTTNQHATVNDPYQSIVSFEASDKNIASRPEPNASVSRNIMNDSITDYNSMYDSKATLSNQ